MRARDFLLRCRLRILCFLVERVYGRSREMKWEGRGDLDMQLDNLVKLLEMDFAARDDTEERGYVHLLVSRVS